MDLEARMTELEKLVGDLEADIARISGRLGSVQAFATAAIRCTRDPKALLQLQMAFEQVKEVNVAEALTKNLREEWSEGLIDGWKAIENELVQAQGEGLMEMVRAQILKPPGEER